MEPLDTMCHQVRPMNDHRKRCELYKTANDYIAERASWLFSMAPLSLYGVNAEVNFTPQVSQYTHWGYSSVTENHVVGEKIGGKVEG